MGSIRVALIALAVSLFGCAVSEELESSTPPASRVRVDAGAQDTSAPPPAEEEPTPSSDPDTGAEPEDAEPPPFPGSEDAEPPPATTCDGCLTDCDDVCAKTPSKCKACDDACYAGPCAGGPPSGPDPCGCIDTCEYYCYFDFDPLACEDACIKSCTAKCGS